MKLQRVLLININPTESVFWLWGLFFYGWLAGMCSHELSMAGEYPHVSEFNYLQPMDVKGEKNEI